MEDGRWEFRPEKVRQGRIAAIECFVECAAQLLFVGYRYDVRRLHHTAEGKRAIMHRVLYANYVHMSTLIAYTPQYAHRAAPAAQMAALQV